MSEYSLPEGMNEEDIDPDEDVYEEVETPAIICKYQGCNERLVYLGRGRKPTYCSEHKGGKALNAVANSTSRISGSNEKLAAQASEVLGRMNSLAALGIMAFGMPVTAMSIAEANEEFKKHAYDALLLDAKLCQAILKTGGQTAGLALFLAYGQMGMIVVPLAITEIRDKRADKQRELDNAAAS